MPQEQDPDVQYAQQQVLQGIMDSVAQAHSGGDKLAIVEALERGIAEAGMSPQPSTWLESTASEIAEGRVVIADRKRGASDGFDAGGAGG